MIEGKAMWKLSISYSWNDREPDLFFSTEEEAWNMAKNMAMKEAENSLEGMEDDEAAEIRILPQKHKIILTYAMAYGGEKTDRSACTYQVENLQCNSEPADHDKDTGKAKESE